MQITLQINKLQINKETAMPKSTNQAANTAVDLRQRFFINNSPVRGDVVRLKSSFASIIAQKNYPEAIKRLLGEMLTAASLLIGTLKIHGRLSIQLQSSDENSLLKWAMAECDHQGNIRGLASWQADTPTQQQAWQDKISANDAFMELGEPKKGVLFINIHPEKGEAYQGIVERSHDNLADCLAHYQRQSAQIPTLIRLGCDGLQAGGILVQMLPLNEQEQQAAQMGHDDDDLWTRLSILTNTIKDDELTKLPAREILYRLYNEEEVVMPAPMSLSFACGCSRKKCESAILQIGEQEAQNICEQQGMIEMDCGFCGSVYRFDTDDVSALFA